MSIIEKIAEIRSLSSLLFAANSEAFLQISVKRDRRFHRVRTTHRMLNRRRRIIQCMDFHTLPLQKRPIQIFFNSIDCFIIATHEQISSTLTIRQWKICRIIQFDEISRSNGSVNKIALVNGGGGTVDRKRGSRAILRCWINFESTLCALRRP